MAPMKMEKNHALNKLGFQNLRPLEAAKGKHKKSVKSYNRL